MSSATNIALNSRTMSGVILISDGVATLENGDLNCDDVISNTVSTGNMITNNLTCKGELRTNTNGPYSIPTATTSITGSLISYGNVLNTGATDITNYGSTYNLLKQGFYFNNINSTQTLTNLAIIDNTQTYFKSQLIGCTAETPLISTSVVNKTYVDSNFMFKTGSVQEAITGYKIFNNRIDLNGGTALVVATGTSSFAGIVDLNAQTTFNNFCPISNTNATLTNHLTTLGFNNGRYVDFTTNGQVISGNKSFTNTTTTNILFTKDFRWNDAGGSASTQQSYLSGVTFLFVPLFNSNVYGFQCRNAGSVTTTPLTINSASTTIANNLVSNNITAPITLGGTNNIYTNLDTFTGGAIINVGAIKNNINVKCNLNIVESVYNNPTKITTINQEGNSMRFTNNGSTNGDYIFTIIEGTTYNPFVINKTSVDLAGDLIIYDPSLAFTKSLIISVVGNNISFNPDQTLSTTYNFITNDSGGTSTTTLIISTASTTVANPLISNSTATFNNGATFNSVIPTTSITATSANHLVNYSTLTGQGYTTLSAVQSNSNTFTSTNTFTGNLVSTLGLIVKDSALAFQNGTKQINTYLTAVNELTFQPFSVSNSYKFQCLNATGTADKSLFITFDKTTIQMQLEVAENATFNSTATFSGDVTLSKTKNNSTYATYNGLNSTYIGYLTEVPPGVYLGIVSNTQYQLGAITLDSTNVGFWTCNYEVEINSITAGSISKIYVFVSDNNVSSTVPIGLPGAKANNFSTQTYTAGDSTYHSGSFSFLQSTTSVIYAVQLKIIIASGTYQRKGQIRMLRIL